MEYMTTVASLENGQKFKQLDSDDVFTAVAIFGPDHIFAESDPPGRPISFHLDTAIIALDNDDNNR